MIIGEWQEVIPGLYSRKGANKTPMIGHTMVSETEQSYHFMGRYFNNLKQAKAFYDSFHIASSYKIVEEEEGL